MVKVSIIVPIYGVEKYIRECLDSLLCQTLRDVEIILINDGSKDNCPQIIDEYAQKDSRVIAIHKENRGYGHSCNVGLEKANGEYVAIVEPDDYVESNMYEDLYAIAKKFDSDIVKSCFYDNLQTERVKRIKKVKWEHSKIPQDKSFNIKECSLFLHYHPSVWSCIYKNSFLKRHNIRFVEAPGAGWTDNPFQVQTMCLAERINYTSNAYYYWRRLNEDESKDLKDYKIPFLRTEEIHTWLIEKGIKDRKILFNLFRRELAYIDLALKSANNDNIEDCCERARSLVRKTDKEFYTDKTLRRSHRTLIRHILNSSNRELILYHKYFFRANYIKMLRRKVASIRYNKSEKTIKIFKNVWNLEDGNA